MQFKSLSIKLQQNVVIIAFPYQFLQKFSVFSYHSIATYFCIKTSKIINFSDFYELTKLFFKLEQLISVHCVTPLPFRWYKPVFIEEKREEMILFSWILNSPLTDNKFLSS